MIFIWKCVDCGHYHSRRTGRCMLDYWAPENANVVCVCPRRKRRKR